VRRGCLQARKFTPCSRIGVIACENGGVFHGTTDCGNVKKKTSLRAKNVKEDFNMGKPWGLFSPACHWPGDAGSDSDATISPPGWFRVALQQLKSSLSKASHRSGSRRDTKRHAAIRPVTLAPGVDALIV
jgi:hypothetical protein